MSQYRCCPYCGAALDQNERCDCVKEGYFGKKPGEVQLRNPHEVPGWLPGTSGGRF